MTLLGIDVSHHQGAVDWFAVARGRVSFAYLKATEGTDWVDSTFATHWPHVQEAGLFRGAYHFARPGRDAETQAAHFASVVGTLGFRDLPPVLDLEVDDGHPADAVLEWARTFVTVAEKLFGRRLMLYTGQFWRGALKNVNDPFFAERPLWLADYRANPVLPASWSRWTFWQYSEGTHNGPQLVPGVRPCDQNRFEGSEDDLDRLCSTAAPPLPDPVPPAGTGQAWPGSAFVWPKTPAVSGPGVLAWQQKMQELGFDVTPDGVFGPQSKAACRAFQKMHGLPADGIVGRRTWAACFG